MYHDIGGIKKCMFIRVILTSVTTVPAISRNRELTSRSNGGMVMKEIKCIMCIIQYILVVSLAVREGYGYFTKSCNYSF